MDKYYGPIVITALGAVSPFGLGIEPLWSALQQGERQGKVLEVVWSALQQSEHSTNTDELPLWGMQVAEEELVALLGKRGLQYWRPGTKFLLGASVLAMREAGLVVGETDPDELGIVVGSNLAGFQNMVDYDYTAITEGPHCTSPMEAPNTLANAPASHLAIRVKARALNTTIASGQCAGLDALGYALKMVRDGRARRIIAGGVEELSPAALWVYVNAQAVSGGRLNDAGQPFAETSTGWLPSEGAAVAVLERRDEALQRGARPLAELAGWSSTFSPSDTPEGRARALKRAARQALDMAQVTPDQVDVVLAGASGLKAQDEAEALALDWLLRENTHASVIAVKGVLGESYGASGLFQTLAAVCMLDRGLIPPTPVSQAEKAPHINGLLTTSHPWPGSAQGTALLLAQDLFGSTSAVVIRGYQKIHEEKAL